MKMQQVSDNCFAVLNEKNRVCDANSGLINRGGVAIDTLLPSPQDIVEWQSSPLVPGPSYCAGLIQW